MEEFRHYFHPIAQSSGILIVLILGLPCLTPFEIKTHVKVQLLLCSSFVKTFWMELYKSLHFRLGIKYNQL